MVRIGPGRRKDYDILCGKAKACGRLGVLPLVHQIRKPRTIKPEPLMEITVNQRQQRRPRLARWPWLLRRLSPEEEVAQPERLAIGLSSSGSQGDAVCLRLEQGDAC